MKLLVLIALIIVPVAWANSTDPKAPPAVTNDALFDTDDPSKAPPVKAEPAKKEKKPGKKKQAK